MTPSQQCVVAWLTLIPFFSQCPLVQPRNMRSCQLLLVLKPMHINDQGIITRTDSAQTNHPRLAKTFFRALDNHRAFITVFFARVGWLEPPAPSDNSELIDYSPFVWALGLPKDNSVLIPTNRNDLPYNKDPKERRAQYYEQYYGPSSTPPTIIHSKLWTEFWSSNLHHTARNVWYRLIHNKIPNLALLNSWMPTTFKNPYCYLCYHKYHPPELPPLMSNNHWFFDCPRTQLIWESIWQQVFSYPALSFTPLKTYVYTLQPMNYVSAKKQLLSSLDTSQVVGYTLRGLWSAHWKWTFQQQQQSPAHITSSIYRSLINLVKEKDLELD